MLDALSKKKLHRLVNPKSFRFFVILYEDTNDIIDIKSYIQEHFPLEKSTTLELKNSTYSKLSNVLYSDEKYSIIYLDDFKSLLKNKNIYEGLNQRRDKLAKYPINLICFYPKAIQEELYNDALKNIPDLWEFRNAIIELSDGKRNKPMMEDIKLKSFSSLGGLSHQSKEEEIIRLEEYIQTVQTDELKNNILGQLGRLEYELGRYEKALIHFEKSLAIQEEIGDKAGEGTTLNNISQIYKAQGDYTTALEYLTKSLAIQKEIGDKAGMCATLFNMGHISSSEDEKSKALAYWVKAYNIAKEIGEAQALQALDGLAQQLQEPLGVAYGESFWDDVVVKHF